jgi:hypothetical protein
MPECQFQGEISVTVTHTSVSWFHTAVCTAVRGGSSKFRTCGDQLAFLFASVFLCVVLKFKMAEVPAEVPAAPPAPAPAAIPAQLSMGGGVETLAAHNDLFVKQTRRGCIQVRVFHIINASEVPCRLGPSSAAGELIGDQRCPCC